MTEPHDSQRFATELEAAKWAALKDLAYGASHEINNPLANIAMRAQALLRDETNQDRRRALRNIHAQAMRATEMIADLMFLARPPRLELQPCNLVEVLEKLAKLESGAGQGSSVAWQPPANAISLTCDPVQLSVAVAALCRNARESAGEGGRVELAAEVKAGEVWITVTDNGPGIPAEMLPHVFNPFFSGREAGRGLGFGLPKARRIVEAHGGQVRVSSQPGQTTVTLVLPHGG